MRSVMIAFALIALYNNPTSSSQTPSSNSENFPWKNHRLPKSIIPAFYDIRLEPNISTSSFAGWEFITLKVVENTDFIVFHAHELTITDIRIAYAGNKTWRQEKYMRTDCLRRGMLYGTFDRSKYYQILNTPFSNNWTEDDIRVVEQLENKPAQQYYVKMDQVIDAGRYIKMRVFFNGSFTDDVNQLGFYRSQFKVNGVKRYMISTQFAFNGARRVFPCMDEPALKAGFRLYIKREKDQISLFNSELSRTLDFSNKELQRDLYRPSRCFPIYSVGIFVASNYKPIQRVTSYNSTIRLFVPEDKMHLGRYALDVAVDLMEFFTNYFDIGNPFKKFDMVAVPELSSRATENFAFAAFEQEAILFNCKWADHNKKFHATELISRAVAQMWFDMLLSVKWWNMLWLRKGIARYLAGIAVDKLYPTMHAHDSLVFHARSTFYFDATNLSHPINVNVKNIREAEANDDDLTNNKILRLLFMLRGAIGVDVFDRGIKNYVKKHAAFNIDEFDLWKEIQENNPEGQLNVSKFMTGWTRQLNYPLVTVSVSPDGNHFILVQERFLINSDEREPDSHRCKWQIPFKYKLSTAPDKVDIVWMNCRNTSIPRTNKETTWLKGNADSEGYFRVNYDERGWNAISNQLKINHTVFSSLDKVSLLDDAFELAKARKISTERALDLCSFLPDETDPFVWEIVYKHILD